MAKKAQTTESETIAEPVPAIAAPEARDIHEDLRREIEIGNVPPDRVNVHGAKLRAVLQGTGTNQEIVLAALASVKELAKGLE